MCFIFGSAQKITGRVINNNKEPVCFAAIQIEETNIFTYSDEKGYFELHAPKKVVYLNISSLGYRSLQYHLNIKDNITNITCVLQEESLKIDEVVINAKSIISSEGSSTYKIGNQAIQQIQAISLGDILSLLPGNKLTTPGFNTIQQANIRTAAASSANAFGTSIIVDGSVINNNANMQSSNPALSFSGGNATPAKGIDLRTISASNIESVQVITGVPSAKYGDITSGAVIVKNKIGKSPLFVSANLTSTSYQVAANKGFILKNNNGVLNTNISYTYSNASPVDRKTFYNNVNLGLRWRKSFNKKLKWVNTTAFAMYLSDDGQRKDPDETYRNTTDVKSQQYQVSVNGRLNLLGKLSYHFSGDVTNQYSHFYNTGVNGPVPIVEALKTGTYFTTYTPLIYTQTTEIRGMPVNFSADISSNQVLSTNNFQINFNTGLQYQYARNRGKGRVISGGVSLPDGVSGSRSAKFHSIPASTNFSLWYETDLKHFANSAIYNARLGLRYDNMNQNYHLLSPRLSASAFFANTFRIRGAWGLAYKAPAMIQLYPGPIYYDYTNMSYYATNALERLAIISTYVHQPNNSNIKPSKGNTTELGLDLKTKPITIQLTGYYKELTNGIYHSPLLLLLNRQNYEVISRPKNQPPVVQEIIGDIDTLVRTISEPKNVYSARTRGIELTVIPQKIAATNTRFNITFSYLKTTAYNNGYNIKTSSYVIGDKKSKFGVYQNNREDIYMSIGNITIIQQIPTLRLIFNLTAELNFTDYSQTRQGSLYPYAYYDSNGKFHKIPKDERNSAKFADLKLPENTYTTYLKPPFYTNYHLQVRKETEKGHSFSFFANNVFWHNPIYERKGTKRTLNSRISFGFSMKFKL